MKVILFDQLKTVFATPPVRLMRLVRLPLQTVSFGTESAWGDGFIVIVKTTLLPVQVFTCGVTVIVAT